MKWLIAFLLMTIVSNVCGNAEDQKKAVVSESDIGCTITTTDANWDAKKATSVVSVEVEHPEFIRASAIPSVRLIALPRKEGIYQDEYWAPFNITTGASTKNWQKIANSIHALSIHLNPFQLLWAPTKSSVWPAQAFSKTVPEGQYILQVQIEVNGAKTFLSNEVKITITK